LNLDTRKQNPFVASRNKPTACIRLYRDCGDAHCSKVSARDIPTPVSLNGHHCVSLSLRSKGGCLFTEST
jgi:hypothetical protein